MKKLIKTRIEFTNCMNHAALNFSSNIVKNSFIMMICSDFIVITLWFDILQCYHNDSLFYNDNVCSLPMFDNESFHDQTFDITFDFIV